MAIVGFAAGLPDLNATETRLLRNQVDIGNAVKPFCGAGAGDELTRLLKTHILQAVTVLKAAKAGNATQPNAALEAWHAGGSLTPDDLRLRGALWRRGAMGVGKALGAT
jgi:hypothetical protein